VLTVSRDGDTLSVAFAPDHTAGQSYVAHVALLGIGLRSNVERGENAGRNLRHDFVALSLADHSLAKSGDQWQADFAFPKTNLKTARLALAVWISVPQSITPIQATGGWLP
jgi:hypothetical protein